MTATIAALTADADRALARLNETAGRLSLPIAIRQYAAAEAAARVALRGEHAGPVGRCRRATEDALSYGLRTAAGGWFAVAVLQNMNGLILGTFQNAAGRIPGDLRGSPAPVACHGEIVFTAPAAADVPALLADLEMFALARDRTPPIVRLAVLYARMITIHPFTDGNGRTARLMVPVYLAWKKILPAPLLWLGPGIGHDYPEYLAAIQAYQAGGPMEDWIPFFLEGVITAAGEAADRLTK